MDIRIKRYPFAHLYFIPFLGRFIPPSAKIVLHRALLHCNCLATLLQLL